MNRTEHELELMRRYLEGVASLEETQELESLIVKDASVRQDFLRYTHLDSALAGVRRSQPPVVAPRRSVWPSWCPLAAAAVVVLGMAALWWSQRGVEVEVVQTTGAVAGEWRAGNRMRLKDVTMVRGSVQLRLTSGVLLDATAPIEMKLLDAMHVRVLSGRVTADVGARGKGFVIETPQTRVVDLGTRFGVDASDAAQTDVVVFEGKVEVYEPGKGSGPLIASLVEGEGLRLAQKQMPRRIECVFTGPRSDDWTTQASGAVIADVRDNQMSAENGKRFYRVAIGGMEAGAEARHTRGRKWFPVGADSLPDWLAGADVVETFATDANHTEFAMTLMLARPAVVFVIQDAQQNVPPSWLQSRFSDTGLRLVIDRSAPDAGVAPGRLFAVWKSAPLPAGAVTLGSQREEGQPKGGKMYGVAAKGAQ
jgi:FecR protein